LTGSVRGVCRRELWQFVLKAMMLAREQVGAHLR
jgi:hypothetical protein